MKKLILLLVITLSTISYSQTEITDDNFYTAINTCLSTNATDGMCTDSEYGAMPDWDVSNVTNMFGVFYNKTTFNGDISGWDVSNVTNMNSMFKDSSFNQPIGDWYVSSVNEMYEMFDGATSFNQPIGDWNVSNVTNMENMFRGANSFNQPIGDWDVSNVTSMKWVFKNADAFNQPIGDWDVSNVTNMYNMFKDSSFNQPIGDWDVSNVTNMNSMFKDSSFNQPIGDWDVSNVTDMNSMFIDTDVFNQSLGSWNVTNVTDMTNMFDNSGLSTPNYDATLISWSLQNVQSGVELGALGINFCNSIDAKARLIDNYGWNIIDDGYSCTTAGLDDQNQLDISIYPNPTSDIVYIDGNYTQLKVVVYDILGKEILNKSITNSIDISHLDNGIYILQLSDGVKLTTQRIIKN